MSRPTGRRPVARPAGLIFGWTRLVLMPDLAVHWPETGTLVVADPHFGKTDHFRQAGIPVPAGSTQADLARLDALLEETGARSLIVLGDFFHAREGRSETLVRALGDWRAARAELEIVLVRGNHDRHAGDPPAAWDVRVVAPPWRRGDFELVHDPAEATGEHPTLAGHVHPVWRMADADGSIVRLPCYHVRGKLLTLPAFGTFTGGHAVRAEAGDRVFLAAPDGNGTVHEMPLARSR